MKSCCMSHAVLCGEGWSYPASRCRYVDVSIDDHVPWSSPLALDEYHIPREMSLKKQLYGYTLNLIISSTKQLWLRDADGPLSLLGLAVVYFDQQTGALHTVYWLKSIFLTLKQLFPSLTEQNKEKKNMFFVIFFCYFTH